MSKKRHVDAFPVDKAWAEDFRQVVREHNEPASYEEHQANGYVEPEPVVEILYEESNAKHTHFDLWFATPSTAFYFGQAWERRLRQETVSRALDLRTRLQALRDRELHLVLKDGLRGISPAEAQELEGLSAQQEALFPPAAQVLGWNWATLTAPGRLRLATPNQVELLLQELTKLIGGQGNG